MGIRKIKAKKYKSIVEYYKDSDHNKSTIAHYISYWVNDPTHKNGGTTKKERVNTTDRNEALKILNERKANQLQYKKDRSVSTGITGATLTLDQVASEYFKERTKRGNIVKDMKKYVQHIGERIFDTRDTGTDKGYVLTTDIKTYEAFIRGRGYVTRYYQRKEDDKSMNIGELLIKDVDVNTLTRLINELNKKGLGAKTVSSILNLLKAIVGNAISEGYIVANPFKNKKAYVNVPKEDRKRLFTPQERKDIFIAAKRKDQRLFILFKMLYYTGQRPASIISLRVRDIHLDQKKISIDSIKDQSGTYAPISDKLYPLLELWIKDCEPDQRLFDVVYTTFQKKAQKIFEKYNKGLDFKDHRYQWASMYSFRHTAATVMLAKTDNIKTVQTVLNHSDPKVTAIYAKLLDDAKLKGVNVL